MYAKPELTVVGSAIAVVLGPKGVPEESLEPPQRFGDGITTNLED